MVLTRETSGDINNRWLWRLEACNSSLGQQGPQVGSLPGLHSCDQSGLHIENLSQEKGGKKKVTDHSAILNYSVLCRDTVPKSYA